MNYGQIGWRPLSEMCTKHCKAIGHSPKKRSPIIVTIERCKEGFDGSSYVPTCLPWFSHDFPMVFLWFSHVFPVFLSQSIDSRLQGTGNCHGTSAAAICCHCAPGCWHRRPKMRWWCPLRKCWGFCQESLRFIIMIIMIIVLMIIIYIYIIIIIIISYQLSVISYHHHHHHHQLSVISYQLSVIIIIISYHHHHHHRLLVVMLTDS